MDENRYRLRDLADTDFPSLARIWTRNDPDRPTTAEEVRNLFRSSDEPRFIHRYLSIVEAASDALVAAGAIWQSSFSYDPRFASVGMSVDPDHQHRGLARRLLEEFEGVARSHQLEGVWGSVRADDPHRVRFFEKAGFREKRRAWISRLDVHEVPVDLTPRSPDRWPADGVVFSTVQEEGADRPEVRERLYESCREAMRDTPRMGQGAEDSRGWFDTFTFRSPGYVPEAMFVARVGETYVAFSLHFRDASRPDVLQISFTGTLPAYRRRGLAGELKRRSVEYARSHGYRYIETSNDSQNPRIWSINEHLGFRQFQVFIMGEKSLRP